MSFDKIENCNVDASTDSLLMEEDHTVVEGVANGIL